MRMPFGERRRRFGIISFKTVVPARRGRDRQPVGLLRSGSVGYIKGLLERVADALASEAPQVPDNVPAMFTLLRPVTYPT